jgi:hypothetical protein
VFVCESGVVVIPGILFGRNAGGENLKNKEIEEFYFKMFRRDYKLPDGGIECGDKPDVILRGSRTVGIEITNFFLEDGSRPGSEQVQRGAREAVVAKAQQLFESRCKGRFELTFAFDRAVPILDQDGLAEKLASMGVQIQVLETGVLPRDVFQHIPELSFAYLNATEYEDARWRISQHYEGVSMSEDQLRLIVKAKEKKLKEYRPCDAYWLLVVVDFIDRAQDQEIPVGDLKNTTSQVFEKIIVYKTCTGSVAETRSAFQARSDSNS